METERNCGSGQGHRIRVQSHSALGHQADREDAVVPVLRLRQSGREGGGAAGQRALSKLPIWDLAGELGKHVPTHRGLCPWPPFLPLSHPVLVRGLRCSGQASGNGSSLPSRSFPEDGGSTLGAPTPQARGFSLLGVNDSLSAAVLPSCSSSSLLLLTAGRAWTWEPCCCAVARGAGRQI